MATHVLAWGREHDPDARRPWLLVHVPTATRYVKKWIPDVQHLPAELSREPWKLPPLSDSPWSCASCTLENPPNSRRCGACRRATGGLYAAPLVPPEEVVEEVCESCGSLDVGWMAHGSFFCEQCWAEWLHGQVVSEPLPLARPDLEANGWPLVPEVALPGLAEEPRCRKGSRWVRGDTLAGA